MTETERMKCLNYGVGGNGAKIRGGGEKIA